MIVRRLSLLLAMVCAALVWSACHSCPLRLLWTSQFGGGSGGSASTVPCCGAFDREDMTIPSAEGGQVDLDNTFFPDEAGHVDAWLVAADCDRLFDGIYPGASPLCRTYIGPVQPGQVSARQSIPSGRYRVIVQAYSSNAKAAKYTTEVGLWGYDCKFNPAGP
jgi:hypothetical protein